MSLLHLVRRLRLLSADPGTANDTASRLIQRPAHSRCGGSDSKATMRGMDTTIFPLTSPPPDRTSRTTKSLAMPPVQVGYFPELRYMGSKRRLLPWIYEVLASLEFETALDPFSG